MLLPPSLYPSAMDALIRLGIPTPPDLLDRMITALSAAPPPPAKRRKNAAISRPSRTGDAPAPGTAASTDTVRSRLDTLSAQELVIVLAAIGLQEEYTLDPPGIVDNILSLVQSR